MVGRLESEDQQGLTGRARVREGRLRLVEEAAVGRIEPGLRQLADRLGAAREGIERHPARELEPRRSWTLTQASVITARIPSDPSSMRSGLGPAPEPGSRLDAQRPPGVTARTDSTRSSMCV